MERLIGKIKQAQKALDTMAEVISFDRPGAVERDAAIQRFEYSVELTWKLARAYLKDIEGLDLASPKAVLRAMREGRMIGLEESVQALKMIDDRNLTSHTYNEVFAQEIYRRLKNHHLIMTTIVDKIRLQTLKPGGSPDHDG